MRLSRSIVGPQEAEALAEVILNDGYLGMGTQVAIFEKEIASFLNVPKEWVVCVGSGTAALQLAIEAVTQSSDEVLVQSLTFVASYQAISATGAKPVSCDVYPKTITIDLRDAKNRLTQKTRAIMPVHYASNPGSLNEVYEFSKKHELRVIEDAAHSFGCAYGEKKIGSFGDIVCFSFDGIKNITSGEGGAVVTKDSVVAQFIRDTRLLGVENDSEKRLANERSWEFDVTKQGYRYHMSNLFAAVGRVQLKRLTNEFAPKRIKLAKRYRERLANITGIQLLDTQLGPIVPHIQPVRVLDGKRDKLRLALEAQGIETGIHYKPNHLLSFFGGGEARLPVCEQLYEELVSLPLHPGLTCDDVERVCHTVTEFMNTPSPKH
jgi:dTDP-4-amino-4,6-dideoxygalactose transaminase